MRDRVVSGALGVLLLAVTGSTPLGDGRATDTDLPDWKIAYQQELERFGGEEATGIDVVTSEHARPLALVRPASDSAHHLLGPVWSPGGSHVAFHVAFSARNGLEVIRADGAVRHRIATGDGISQFRWSRDSSRIAYLRGCRLYAPQDGYHEGCAHARIDVVGRNGSRHRLLVRPANLSPSAWIELQDWSSRGALLYVVTDRGRDRLFSVEGRPTRVRLLAESRAGRLGGAAWSTDGRNIAYMRRCADNLHGEAFCDLAVMTAAGGSKRTLLRWRPRASGPSEDAPTWIPGSTRLVLTTDGFDGRTRVIDARTGASTVLSQTAWHNMTAASNGRTIGGLYWPADSGGSPVLVLAGLDGSALIRQKVPLRSVGDESDVWIE